MIDEPQMPAEQYPQPVGKSRRRNRLAITAASFAIFALFQTVSSLLSYKSGTDIGTDYAVGYIGAPIPFAIVGLACGIPALLRIRRPADEDGRSWDGKEPAIVSVAVAYLVIFVAVVRITSLLASR
jgi:uncharacterized membrane protein YhaH (DUF805 family)